MRGEIEFIGPVAEILGVSLEEIRGMSLTELSDRAFQRGLRWSVSTGMGKEGEDGRLRIIATPAGREALTQDTKE